MSGEKIENAKDGVDEWDFGEEIEWNMGDDGTERATWDDVAEMAGFEESEQEVWQLPKKPVREAERLEGAGEIVDLAELMGELQDGRYELMGHGTVSADVAKKIIREGVKVGGPGRDTDIDSNFFYLDHDYEGLKGTLDNWQHKNARQIALMRVPVRYKLPFGNFKKDTYGVFYHDEGDGGVYEGDYVYGWYDADSGMVHKNADYHGDLDNAADVEYMEKVYQDIKQSYLEQLPEDERGDWEELAKMFYDYTPE